MSTEIMQSSPSGKPTLRLYSEIFQSQQFPMSDRVMMAVGRLLTVMRQQLEDVVLQAWAQNLEKFSAEELIWAFTKTEREVSAFPAIAHIVQHVEEQQFHAELYGVLLKGLLRHGPRWEDIPAWQDPGQWDYTSAEAVAKKDRIWREGPRHPAESAPPLSERMRKAVKLFGHGSFEVGMKRLKRDDPSFWDGETEITTGQHGRQASQVERDLWNCWLEAGE